MKKTLFLGGAALLTIGTAALAQPGGAREQPTTRAQVTAMVDARFAKMDLNQDGVIDDSDRAAMQAERFAKLNTDGDGALTEAEMKAGHEARRARMQERRADAKANRPEPTAEQKAKWAERRAKRGDKRGNRQESRFAAKDTDGNGTLSAAEFAARPSRANGADGMPADGHRNGRHGRHGMGMMGDGRRQQGRSPVFGRNAQRSTCTFRKGRYGRRRDDIRRRTPGSPRSTQGAARAEAGRLNRTGVALILPPSAVSGGAWPDLRIGVMPLEP